jgi:hypothetical protein
MIRADDPLNLTGRFRAKPHTAMAADIVKAVNGAIIPAQD